ncbi:helix-turn-helix domain-containing protein [Pseudomonas shirazensis]
MVADLNSFTRAAELLDSTQSAISRLPAYNPPISTTT